MRSGHFDREGADDAGAADASKTCTPGSLTSLAGTKEL